MERKGGSRKGQVSAVDGAGLSAAGEGQGHGGLPGGGCHPSVPLSHLPPGSSPPRPRGFRPAPRELTSSPRRSAVLTGTADHLARPRRLASEVAGWRGARVCTPPKPATVPRPAHGPSLPSCTRPHHLHRPRPMTSFPKAAKC